MKQIHKLNRRPAKDTGFGVHFNPNKSPHAHIEMKDGKPVVTYAAKHRKYVGRVVWEGKGTYMKARHKELPHPFKLPKLVKPLK